MSCTCMYGVKTDGTFEEVAVYQNSWGWCSFVWDQLCKRYCIETMMLEKGLQADIFAQWEYLWEVVADHSLILESWEHNVLSVTSDYAAVKREHFDVLSKSLVAFQEYYEDATVVCHLEKMAADIGKLAENITTICWHGTSVAENLWVEYDEEIDEAIEYNFAEGKKHWFLSPEY